MTDDEEVVLAIHASIPFDASTPWGGTREIWGIEWINGTGPRGSGCRLAAALLAEVDIYVGFGCNKLSEAAFASMGVKVILEIHRSVVVTNGFGLRMALMQLDVEVEPVAGAFSGRSKPHYAVLSDIGKIVIYEGVIVDRRGDAHELLLRSRYLLDEGQRWNPSWKPSNSVVMDNQGFKQTWYLDCDASEVGTDIIPPEQLNRLL